MHTKAVRSSTPNAAATIGRRVTPSAQATARATAAPVTRCRRRTQPPAAPDTTAAGTTVRATRAMRAREARHLPVQVFEREALGGYLERERDRQREDERQGNRGGHGTAVAPREILESGEAFAHARGVSPRRPRPSPSPCSTPPALPPGRPDAVEPGVDRARRALAVAHREDDGGGAADDVAAGEHAGHARHPVLVRDACSPYSLTLSSGRGAGEQRVGPRPDRDDDEVAVDRELGARDRRRAGGGRRRRARRAPSGRSAGR